MQWDLATELKQLEIYYSLTDISDKKKKKNKADVKKSSYYSQASFEDQEPYMLIDNSINVDGKLSVIVLRNPSTDFKEVLGEIRCNMDSFTGKLQKVGLERNSGAITITILTDLHKLQINGVQQTYCSVQDQEAMNAFNVLERVKEGCYLCQEQKCPLLLEEDWASRLLSSDDDVPTQIFRADFDGEKPILSYVFNKNFIRLLGIQPNLLMQLMMKDQMIPQLMDETSIFIWTKRVKNLIESYDSPIINEYETMLITYEGLRIGVKVRDTFLNTFDPNKKKFIYVQKSQFFFKNDNITSLLYEENRINKNTNQLMEHEGLFVENIKSEKKLLYENSMERKKIKHQTLNPCGFKVL